MPVLVEILVLAERTEPETFWQCHIAKRSLTSYKTKHVNGSFTYADNTVTVSLLIGSLQIGNKFPQMK